jgi:hypothetical protein
MLSHLVAASYSEIDATFADECGYIGGRKKDEREREVLDECDVET